MVGGGFRCLQPLSTNWRRGIFSKGLLYHDTRWKLRTPARYVCTVALV